MRFDLRPALLSLVFLTASCAQLETQLHSLSGDKYPYVPQFVAPADLPVETTLKGPEKKGTEPYEKEVKQIMTLQARLTELEKAEILKEDKITPTMMVQPVLGAQYTEEAYPKLYALLKRAASDAWRIGDVNQDYWKSPRPWMAEPERVKLIAPKIERFGYPSGHTTTNTTWAYVLSELYPAQRDQFIARANNIAQHRVEGGVHFPHDVAGGQELAAQIFKKMQVHPEFRKELEAVRVELGLAKPTVH